MKKNNNFPPDPVTLATDLALAIALDETGFGITPAQDIEIKELWAEACDYGLNEESYLVSARRGVALPMQVERNKKVDYLDFYDVVFEGRGFFAYSKAAITGIGRISTLNALCLAFNNIQVLPGFEGLPDGYVMHVPVLAVDLISPQYANHSPY